MYASCINLFLYFVDKNITYYEGVDEWFLFVPCSQVSPKNPALHEQVKVAFDAASTGAFPVHAPLTPHGVFAHGSENQTAITLPKQNNITSI